MSITKDSAHADPWFNARSDYPTPYCEAEAQIDFWSLVSMDK